MRTLKDLHEEIRNWSLAHKDASIAYFFQDPNSLTQKEISRIDFWGVGIDHITGLQVNYPASDWPKPGAYFARASFLGGGLGGGNHRFDTVAVSESKAPDACPNCFRYNTLLCCDNKACSGCCGKHQTRVMQRKTLKSELLEEGVNGGWQAVAEETAKRSRDVVLAQFKGTILHRPATTFLKSKLGFGMWNLSLGLLLPQVPRAAESEHVMRVAQELRVGGFRHGLLSIADKLVDAITGLVKTVDMTENMVKELGMGVPDYNAKSVEKAAPVRVPHVE